MTQDDMESVSRLVSVLSRRFADEEALNLAVLLSHGRRSDSISYEEIDIAPELKEDIILLAYEERVMLPVRSVRGSAWEDRILDFNEQERYHMPRVVRLLVDRAEETGEWDLAYAVGEALREAGESRVEEMVKFLDMLKSVAPRHEMDVAVMQAVGAELSLGMDMHEALDRFVRCGIMSPCTRRSLHTGFASYEMNPCLYWDS